jgi:hypothetical protein
MARTHEKQGTPPDQTHALDSRLPPRPPALQLETVVHAMPHRHRKPGFDESPSPRPVGCYAFLLRPASSRRAGYRRLDPAPKGAVRVEVGPAAARNKERSVFHVDPAVLDAGPVRRLLAAAGRRLAGGGVAVAVDALLFEHLLWLATTAEDGDAGSADLSEIVEFYSQDDDEDER